MSPPSLRVFHPDHLDAGPLEVGDGRVAVGVGGQHHRPLPGLDRVQVDQPAHGGGEHDPGQVVAREHVGPLDQARRHHQRLGAGPDEALGFRAAVAPLEDRDRVAVVAPEHHRVGQHLDARLGGDEAGQLGQHRQVGLAAPAQMAAEGVLLLDQQHRRARPGGADGRRHPGRAAAGDEDVGMSVALLRADVRGARRHRPGVDEPPQHALVGRPREARAHEGLVVEAGREEAPGEPVHRLRVQPQRGPGVLGGDGHAVGRQPVGAADVGLVPHLDHAAGVVEGGGEQAARAVVFQAPGEHPLPGGGQRGDDGVARVAPDGAPVPGELHRLAAVDHLARLRRQPHRRCGLAHLAGPPAGISAPRASGTGLAARDLRHPGGRRPTGPRWSRCAAPP